MIPVTTDPDSFRSPDLKSAEFFSRLLKLFRIVESAAMPAESGRQEQEHRVPAEENGLPDSKLMLRFASLGDNCELGMVQHYAKAEAMDLFRFSGIPLHSLLDTLRTGLHGIDAPENIEIQLRGCQPGRREFIFCHTTHVLESHTQVVEGQQPGHRVFVREQRRVGFLARMMLSDLRTGGRIMVVKRNVPMELPDVMPLFRQLRERGPNTLLWVEQARHGQTPGTVEVLQEGLLKGHIERFAPHDDVLSYDAAAWLPICRRAHALWQQMRHAIWRHATMSLNR